MRPSWVPKHVDWCPGDDAESISWSNRLATKSDRVAVRVLLTQAGLRISRRMYDTWCEQNCVVLRVAVRNQQHIIGVCASVHDPHGTHILACYVPPEYYDWGIEERLLTLALLELPERPAWFTLPGDAYWWQETLKSFGWRAVAVETDDDGDLYQFEYSPSIGRTDDSPSPSDTEECSPPSWDDSGGCDSGDCHPSLVPA